MQVELSEDVELMRSRDAQASGPVAQWIRHRPTEPGIAGSSPAGVILILASIHQERLLARTPRDPSRHEHRRHVLDYRGAACSSLAAACGSCACRGSLLCRGMAAGRSNRRARDKPWSDAVCLCIVNL